MHTGIKANPTKTSATPTISTSAYADGDLVGGKITLKEALPTDGKAQVQALLLADDASVAAELTVVLFGRDPENTTFTDQNTFDIHDDDLTRVVGTFRFRGGTGEGADYESFNDNAFGLLSDFTLPVSAVEGTLYAAIVSRGTPSYDASDDLTLSVITE